MINVKVTYRMDGMAMDESGNLKKERTETTSVIPMADAVAEDILSYQARSVYVGKLGRVHKLLKEMAVVQGYSDACFVRAKRTEAAHSQERQTP